MRDFVWLMTVSEVLYNSQVIACFKPDELDIKIGAYPQKGLSQTELKFSGITQLQEQGYNIQKLSSTDEIRRYNNIIMNSSAFGVNGEFEGKTLPHSRCIMISHSVDIYIQARDRAAHWHIFASQRQAEVREVNKILPSDNMKLFQYLMSLPAHLKDEFTYSGPYHIGNWAAKRKSSKRQLQEELAETFHFDFDFSKPVVAFLLDEFCHEQQLLDGLRRLAPHVNLVIKGTLPSVPGSFAYPDIGYAPNLLRFAADYILAGYFSGTLASSTMLGLPVIPYYTSMIYYKGRRQNKRDRYTRFLNRNCRKNDIRLDILETLNPPLDLQNTQGILDRFADKVWWAEYRRRLPAVQQAVFGNYVVEDAAEKTAQLIRKVFNQGTFGEDAVAARLRPEAGRIAVAHVKNSQQSLTTAN